MCSPPPLPKQLDISTCLGKVCFLHLLLHDTSDQCLLQGNTENSGFSITSSWSTAAELLQGEPSTTVKHCIVPSLLPGSAVGICWGSSPLLPYSDYGNLCIHHPPSNPCDLCLDQNMYYVYMLLPLMLHWKMILPALCTAGFLTCCSPANYQGLLQEHREQAVIAPRIGKGEGNPTGALQWTSGTSGRTEPFSLNQDDNNERGVQQALAINQSPDLQ